jgi:hypothetical protein
MAQLNIFLNYAPNYVVVLVFSGVMAACSVVVTVLVRKLLPFEFDSESTSLANTVHTSLIGFSVLLLAFAITEARGNLAKATDAVSLEAFQLRQCDRQLLSYGAEATAAARKQLVVYAKSIVEDEWPLLALLHPTESTKTKQHLSKLTEAIHNLPAQSPRQEALKPTLDSIGEAIERLHDGRLEKAANQVAGIFWAMIISLVGAGMLFNVRYKPTTLNYILIGAHMAAIGAAIAFLAMLDAPFRGETSVPPALITHAIAKLSGNTL